MLSKTQIYEEMTVRLIPVVKKNLMSLTESHINQN